MAIELVLWAPLLVACVAVVIAGFRIVEATDQVSASADAAARAASLAQNPASAQGEARAAAQRALAQKGRSCRHLEVWVNTGQFHPGGWVRVRVRCTADLSDLAGFGLPGSKTFRHTAEVPIDSHRVVVG